MSAFGALLRAHRDRVGLSQNRLATLSGINVGTINRLERGVRPPTGPAQVRALARALGLADLHTDALLQAAGLSSDGADRALARRQRALARYRRWRAA